MNILITGAGGMVGSHLYEMMCSDNNMGDVVGTYYKPTTDINEISYCNGKLIECDVRYPDMIRNIIKEYKPDFIYHLAAQSYPTVSWVRPYETLDINIQGTISIFEAIKDMRRFDNTKYDPVVVVACSSAEYGETLNLLREDQVKVKESAELKPLHPYGVSKVAQDLLSFQYFKNDGIKCIRARIFNSTGTRKVNDVTSDFTRRAIESEKRGDYKFKVGNLESRRAIMDQRDLIHALVLLANKGVPGDVYNVCSENIYVMRDIIRIIEEEIQHPLELEVDEKLLRSTDEKIIVGDTTKLKADTGWKQEISMQETVRDMLQYWREKYK